MKTTSQGFSRIGVLAPLLALWCTGCPPEPMSVVQAPDDSPLSVVIERVNRNAERMDFLLRAASVSASGEYFNAEKKPVSFEANGTLYFRRPRNMHLKLSLLQGDIEIGSNEQDFWVWKRIDHDQYWWGRHDFLAELEDPEIPARPDYLVEVLGLFELPPEINGEDGPVFWVEADSYRFMFFDRDESGQLRVIKTVEVDRWPPYLVKAITYFEPAGHPLMRATLEAYQEIAGTGVQLPREIRLAWLYEQRWLRNMRLRLSRVERSDNTRVEPERILRSPLQRGLNVGEVIRVDHPPLPTLVPATRESPEVDQTE